MEITPRNLEKSKIMNVTIIAIAKKCGICQQKSIENKIQETELILFVAAVHPPITGSAPGTEPIKVLNVLYLLLGV